MPNPYYQVARTYLQHPFSSVKRSLLISGSVLFFAFVFLDNGFSLKQDFPPAYLFPFIALSAYWAVHVKRQFADARASLTPGFRKIHGVVATITAIVFVIILPGAAAPLIHWQPLGFVSILILFFGIILWYILRPGRTFFFFMMSGFILIQQKPVFNAIEQIFLGNEPVQAFIIIGIGVILSITGIIRLFLLNEEILEYHLSFKKNKDGRAKLSDLQWQKLNRSCYQGLWRWLVKISVVRMIYHARNATDSYWSRMHRWNYSGLSVWLAFFYAILINLFLTLIFYFSSTNSPPGMMMYVTAFVPILIIYKH